MTVPEQHRLTICRQGQGAACCSYLMMGPRGWTCAKTPGLNPGLREMLDERRAAGTMRAMGDNCDGWGVCQFPGCTADAVSACDHCDQRFCTDHGSPGGDREGGTNPGGSPYGAFAVPAQCWLHGGFNTDE